ncbi:transposon TX1 putative protein, partial [Trifolium medium]|nr:transposon TX1 putative protein [Trifolium medium]
MAIGRSGGLITMWDSNKGSLVDSFQGQGYLGVVLLWGVKKTKCVIVNVYASCVLQAKKALWVDLLVAMRIHRGEHYCIMGDFNSVRCLGERNGVRGGSERSEDTRLFNVFIENTGLIDLPLMGRKYTWMQPNGREVVEGEWTSYQVNGWTGYVLKEKLKRLKGALRIWNKEVYGSVDAKIEALTGEIELLELKGERVGLSEEEQVERKTKFNQLWLLLKSKDSLEFQKSRSRWLKEGDANTSFFHECVKSRKRSNTLVALKKGREWLSRPEDIRLEVVSYFQKHYEEVSWERPKLDGVDFKQLTANEASMLEVVFEESEVAGVIELSDGNKSPGPDGFNFSFFKNFWNILKKDVLRLFQEFHVTAKLPPSFSSYFIALIPKVLSPHQISDFRPISLL